MMRLTLLLLALAHAAPRAAPTLESAYAVRLVRTRRAVDVERLRGQYDRARVARLGCGLQIARGTAPVECYAILATERAWHILDEAHVRRRRRRLDAACVRASLDLRVPGGDVSLAEVSPACVARIREARLTLEYRRADRGWSED